MTTELVTFKMEDKFLSEVDETVKAAGYQNRTEFIRAALREKIDDVKLKEAMKEVRKMWGKAPRKTTDADIHKARQKVFEELEKELLR